MKSKKMRINLTIILTLCLAFSIVGVGSAADTQVVLNFDNLTSYVAPIPSGYAGLNWQSGWYSTTAVYGNYLGHSHPTKIQFIYDDASKAWIDFGTDVIFDGAYFGGHSETGEVWFEGWRDNALVATSAHLTVQDNASIYLPANFGVPVDKIYVVVASQTRMDEFCMDDLTYTIPGDIPVNIDIMPNDTNAVNLKSKGLMPVGILGSTEFNVTAIDPTTVKIGDVGIVENGSKLKFNFEDINMDGYMDAICMFSIPTLITEDELDASTTNLTITGDLLNNGGQFEGTDNIVVVPTN